MRQIRGGEVFATLEELVSAVRAEQRSLGFVVDEVDEGIKDIARIKCDRANEGCSFLVVGRHRPKYKPKRLERDFRVEKVDKKHDHRAGSAPTGMQRSNTVAKNKTKDPEGPTRRERKGDGRQAADVSGDHAPATTSTSANHSRVASSSTQPPTHTISQWLDGLG